MFAMCTCTREVPEERNGNPWSNQKGCLFLSSNLLQILNSHLLLVYSRSFWCFQVCHEVSVPIWRIMLWWINMLFSVFLRFEAKLITGSVCSIQVPSFHQRWLIDVLGRFRAVLFSESNSLNHFLYPQNPVHGWGGGMRWGMVAPWISRQHRDTSDKK